jgi:hypothetical protein
MCCKNKTEPVTLFNEGTRHGCILESGWSASRYSYFTSRVTGPSSYGIRDWVGSRAGLEIMARKKFLPLPGIERWSSNP